MQLWDMLSILVLILTVCMAGYFCVDLHKPWILLQYPPPADLAARSDV